MARPPDGKVRGLSRSDLPEDPKGRYLISIEAAANLQVPVADAGKVDTSKFPGGLVPTKMPPKRINGRIPGGRR